MIEVVILVGGLGKRLAGVIADIPKPLAPIAGKPFLNYVLKWLDKQNVGRVILAAGHRSEHIVKYCQDNSFNFQLEVSLEDTPLGTGGALRKAMTLGTQDSMIALNGDTYFPVSLAKLLEFHAAHKFAVSMALKHVDDTSRYGAIILENSFVRGFSEKNVETKRKVPGLINGGVAAFRRAEFISKTPTHAFSLEKNFFEASASESNNTTLGGIEFDVPFLDIGIPDDLQLAQKLIPEWTKP